jgi:hypothetical protein
MAEPEIAYRHTVLFVIHGSASDVSYQQALLLLQELGQGNPDILEWEIAPSLDRRKGRIIGEQAVFRNWDAYQRFHESAKHADVGNFMSCISDWLVWDRLGE